MNEYLLSGWSLFSSFASIDCPSLALLIVGNPDLLVPILDYFKSSQPLLCNFPDVKVLLNVLPLSYKNVL
jgi:hypothetical protein